VAANVARVRLPLRNRCPEDYFFAFSPLFLAREGVLLPPAVEVLMRKEENIFLNTELIFKWPKRDFIATPKLFPLGGVRLGAGARRGGVWLRLLRRDGFHT